MHFFFFFVPIIHDPKVSNNIVIIFLTMSGPVSWYFPRGERASGDKKLIKSFEFSIQFISSFQSSHKCQSKTWTDKHKFDFAFVSNSKSTFLPSKKIHSCRSINWKTVILLQVDWFLSKQNSIHQLVSRERLMPYHKICIFGFSVNTKQIPSPVILA